MARIGKQGGDEVVEALIDTPPLVGKESKSILHVVRRKQ